MSKVCIRIIDSAPKMHTRLQPLSSGYPKLLRSIQPLHQSPLCLRLQRRSITADEKPLPKSEASGPGPNQDQLPHVSEEAAAINKAKGERGPEIEQGTPVEEVCRTMIVRVS